MTWGAFHVPEEWLSEPLGDVPPAGLVTKVNKSADFTPSLGFSDFSDFSPVGRKAKFHPLVLRVSRMAKGVPAVVSELDSLLAESKASATGGDRLAAFFVTLTLRPGVDWAPGMISSAMDLYRKWCLREGHSAPVGVWVAELQKRGAVHYHILALLPRRARMPAWDSEGFWPHGMSNVKRLPEGVLQAGCYLGKLASYLSKLAKAGAVRPERLAGFPKGCRLFAEFGLSSPARDRVRFACAPQWLRSLVPFARLRRVRGGWRDLERACVYRTPWEFDGFHEGEAVFVCTGSGWVQPVADWEPWAERLDRMALDRRIRREAEAARLRASVKIDLPEGEALV